jgi:uncharacterized protein
MQHNPVGWFEIYVQDPELTKSFYEAVFQTTLTHMANAGVDLWCFPMHNGKSGASGALVKMEGAGPSTGLGTLVYFTCVNCEVEQERAVAAGGKVLKPKFSIGEYGFISIVSDPEGNTIGLHSRE